MQRFLVGIGSIFVVCTGLIGAVHAVSRQDPPPRVAVLLPDDGCPAPCWQGLRPGAISEEAVEQWAADRPAGWRVEPVNSMGPVYDWQVQVAGASFGLMIDQGTLPTIDRISLLPDDLTIGDLIAALGEPDYVTINAGPSGGAAIEVHLFYAAERLIADGALYQGHDLMLPGDLPVAGLRYEAQPWGRSVVALDWRGLGTLDRAFPGGLAP